MDKAVQKFQGIHPGAVLARELKKRHLRQLAFATGTGIPAQTLNAFIKGKRKLPIAQALKVDQALGMEAGTMAVLQVLYDTRQAVLQQSRHIHPDLSKYRKILFWDTDFNQIDWQGKASAVIRRVLERGNEEEYAETVRFYGEAQVNALASAGNQSSDNRWRNARVNASNKSMLLPEHQVTLTAGDLADSHEC
ncbi:helix-turn-helix transcriptional regulator [Mucilaginibacter robiniae]|uniref:helix-turn-helix transcriptional regulator n=1 Tax=Mucilaginibacter robiniae TaxID=2728022 RepID=UPI001B7CE4DD|nr:helix-turn-helix domain-containing protein [Mucilaginibacter robiniae]